MFRSPVVNHKGANKMRFSKKPHGVVTITGTASSKAKVGRISQIARSAWSVNLVESTVSVEETN